MDEIMKCTTYTKKCVHKINQSICRDVNVCSGSDNPDLPWSSVVPKTSFTSLSPLSLDSIILSVASA